MFKHCFPLECAAAAGHSASDAMRPCAHLVSQVATGCLFVLLQLDLDVVN